MLGTPIAVWIESDNLPLNGPTLYEYAAVRDEQLLGVYFGMARQGIGRPLQQYGAVLNTLRENRGSHKFGDDNTPSRYSTSQAWGFRWVHHQLEKHLFHGDAEIALTLRVIASPTVESEQVEPIGSDNAIEARPDDPIATLPGNANFGHLKFAERAIIEVWKHSPVCWNGKTMKSVHDNLTTRAMLDEAWL